MLEQIHGAAAHITSNSVEILSREKVDCEHPATARFGVIILEKSLKHLSRPFFLFSSTVFLSSRRLILPTCWPSLTTYGITKTVLAAGTFVSNLRFRRHNLPKKSDSLRENRELNVSHTLEQLPVFN